MVATLLNMLISGWKGNRTRRSQQPREVTYGDVVCVAGTKASHPATAPALGLPWPSKGDFLKRYAIWTGENFILYGEDRSGRNIVHEESFHDFLQIPYPRHVSNIPDTPFLISSANQKT